MWWPLSYPTSHRLVIKTQKRLKLSLCRARRGREVMLIRKKRSPMVSGRGEGNIPCFIVLFILPDCAFHDLCSFCFLSCCSLQVLLWYLFFFHASIPVICSLSWIFDSHNYRYLNRVRLEVPTQNRAPAGLCKCHFSSHGMQLEKI